MLRNMNKLIILLASLLVATGCDFADHNSHGFEPSIVEAPDKSGWPAGLRFPMSLEISPDFTPEEQAGIVQAVDRWKERTNGVADVTPFIGTMADSPCRVSVLENIPDDAVSPSEIGQAVGAPNWAKCNIHLIRSEMEYIGSFERAPDYTTIVDQVMTHELGHVYGLGHLDDPKSIMAASYDFGNVTLDDSAINAFCELRGCPNGIGAIQ